MLRTPVQVSFQLCARDSKLGDIVNFKDNISIHARTNTGHVGSPDHFLMCAQVSRTGHRNFDFSLYLQTVRYMLSHAKCEIY